MDSDGGRGRLRHPARALFIVWLGWAACQSYSFLTALKRYAVGIDGSWRLFVLDPDWQPPGGIVTSITVNTLLIVATAWLAWKESTRASDRNSVPLT